MLYWFLPSSWLLRCKGLQKVKLFQWICYLNSCSYKSNLMLYSSYRLPSRFILTTMQPLLLLFPENIQVLHYYILHKLYDHDTRKVTPR